MLMNAVSNSVLVDMLIEKGANVHASANGRTALHAAAALYKAAPCVLQVCESLVRAGAAIDNKDNGKKTPLILAAEAGNLHLVTFFLDHGAAVNVKKDSGVLIAVVQNPEEECVKVVKALIAKGVDFNNATNISGDTPLILAATFGNVGVCKFLIECKCDVNRTNSKGWVPLHYAAKNDSLVPTSHIVAQILLDAGADASLKTRDKKETPLQIAKRYVERYTTTEPEKAKSGTIMVELFTSWEKMKGKLNK